MRFPAVAILVTTLACATLAPAALSARQAAELYTCPMHANVVEAKAGRCPLCRMALTPRAASADEAGVLAFFKAYDAAVAGRNLDALGAMYAPEVTVYDGGGVVSGWRTYRDTQLGPQLKSAGAAAPAHTNVAPHLIGADGAYVTAEYQGHGANGRLATYTLVKTAAGWKIRHAHYSTR